MPVIIMSIAAIAAILYCLNRDISREFREMNDRHYAARKTLRRIWGRDV